MLYSLRHPHIVIIFGACDDVNNLMIVTELMAGGDLFHAIRASPAQLAWSVRGRHVALQVAEALHYLHTLQPPVVHRDIKSLLTAEYLIAKVADLGLARTKSQVLMPPQHAYTPAYATPEVHNSQHASEKVDIYSFGVLVWELLTQQMPVRGELRLPPSVQPAALRRLVQKCIEQNAHLRSSAAELVICLRALIEDGTSAAELAKLKAEADLKAEARLKV
ncbi:kinase-like domain-containing protein [Pavlovales sp. CCMP2436]|nr:kinase-like domain-containing protein [Pavlovales sp. CCMP2436]